MFNHPIEHTHRHSVCAMLAGIQQIAHIFMWRSAFFPLFLSLSALLLWHFETLNFSKHIRILRSVHLEWLASSKSCTQYYATRMLFHNVGIVMKLWTATLILCLPEKFHSHHCYGLCSFRFPFVHDSQREEQREMKQN